ncbi:MAG: tRNA1(Val) (adenine(37)-N6)-methyltransferase [Myxococcota bacterium]
MRQIPPSAASPGPGETIDQIIGDWWVYQLKDGHRFSTDDLLTAWRAATWRPQARRLLDLGCGIGSVGTYTLGILGHPDATLTGIEAQDVSIELNRRSVALNGLTDRVTLHHGDLRDSASILGETRFEVVTGSPPYIPLGKGVVSKHPQRAACRFELRGSVYDYCQAAKRHLEPGGTFTYVMSARDPRTDDAPSASGLAVVERFDVVFRSGDAPMIRVVTCMHEDTPDLPSMTTDCLVIRESDGSMSERYAQLRRSFGWSVDGPTR